MDDTPHGRLDSKKILAAYDAMREQLVRNPEEGKAVLRATAKLDKDVRITGRIGKFNFTCDEPPERGGNDEAPSPLEYFLIGAVF